MREKPYPVILCLLLTACSQPSGPAPSLLEFHPLLPAQVAPSCFISDVMARVEFISTTPGPDDITRVCPLEVGDDWAARGECAFVAAGEILDLRLIYYIPVAGEVVLADAHQLVDLTLVQEGEFVITFDTNAMVWDYDDDSDGYNNLYEACTATDPKDPLSYRPEGCFDDKRPPAYISAIVTAPTTMEVLLAEPECPPLIGFAEGDNGFLVTVNSAMVPILSVQDLGALGAQGWRLQISLSQPILPSDRVMLSYDPEHGTLSDSAEIQNSLQGFENEPVKNTQLNDEAVSPVVARALSFAPSVVDIFVTEAQSPPLVAFAPGAPGFTANVNGQPVPIQAAYLASGFPNVIRLYLDATITEADQVTVSYNQSLGAVTDSALVPNALVSFLDVPVEVSNLTAIVVADDFNQAQSPAETGWQLPETEPMGFVIDDGALVDRTIGGDPTTGHILSPLYSRGKNVRFEVDYTKTDQANFQQIQLRVDPDRPEDVYYYVAEEYSSQLSIYRRTGHETEDMVTRAFTWWRVPVNEPYHYIIEIRDNDLGQPVISFRVYYPPDDPAYESPVAQVSWTDDSDQAIVQGGYVGIAHGMNEDTWDNVEVYETDIWADREAPTYDSAMLMSPRTLRVRFHDRSLPLRGFADDGGFEVYFDSQPAEVAAVDLWPGTANVVRITTWLPAERGQAVAVSLASASPVTDQAYNPLAPFGTQVAQVDQTAPVVLSALAPDPHHIDLLVDEADSLPIVGFQYGGNNGFIMRRGDEELDIGCPADAGPECDPNPTVPADQPSVVRLPIVAALRYMDDIIISYDPQTGTLTDSAPFPNPLAAFQNMAVDTNIPTVTVLQAGGQDHDCISKYAQRKVFFMENRQRYYAFHLDSGVGQAVAFQGRSRAVTFSPDGSELRALPDVDAPYARYIIDANDRNNQVGGFPTGDWIHLVWMADGAVANDGNAQLRYSILDTVTETYSELTVIHRGEWYEEPQICQNGEGDLFVVARGCPRIFHSTNGGATWGEIGDQPLADAIPTRGYTMVCDPSGSRVHIFTYTDLDPDPDYELALDIHWREVDHGVVSEPELILSQELDDGPLFASSVSAVVDPEGRVYMGNRSNQTVYILARLDGDTWTMLPDVQVLLTENISLSIDQGTLDVYLAEIHNEIPTINVSRDFGVTWEQRVLDYSVSKGGIGERSWINLVFPNRQQMGVMLRNGPDIEFIPVKALGE